METIEKPDQQTMSNHRNHAKITFKQKTETMNNHIETMGTIETMETMGTMETVETQKSKGASEPKVRVKNAI